MGISLLALPPLPTKPIAEEEDRVRDLVRRALGGHQTPRRGVERRREQRHPYPYAIYLTPVDNQARPVQPEPIVVIGKHLSEHGLDFYCQQPIPHRLMVASLECGRDEWVGLMLDLTWCRFTKHGWYENGGRFVGLAQTQPKICRKTA